MANKVLLSLIFSLVPLYAAAQAPAASPAPSPAPSVPPAAVPAAQAVPEFKVENVVIGKDEFTRMQREILILKKRLEETELRAQVIAKTKDLEKLSAPTPAPEIPVIFRAMRQSIDGDRVAQFVMVDGSSVLAREGETLPNGMRVSSIRTDSVTLRKGSVERRVGVGGTTEKPVASGASSGMMPMGRPF